MKKTNKKTVKPKKVEIVPGATYLEAAKVQQLQCKATGGNPPAVVTWWMNNVQLKNVEIIVSGSFPSTWYPNEECQKQFKWRELAEIKLPVVNDLPHLAPRADADKVDSFPPCQVAPSFLKGESALGLCRWKERSEMEKGEMISHTTTATRLH